MNRFRFTASFALAAVTLTAHFASAASPYIFFSDLDSGPKTGGRTNNGAIVTIYGVQFGATRGLSYITVGGQRVANYLLWSDMRISFQLGSAAVTGDIVVTAAAQKSNGVPFMIRPGRIFFVATNGRDGDDGSFNKPWRTLLYARDSIQPGDTVYAMDGVSQTVDDGQGWRASMLLRNGGAEGAPMALVAYPGATVTIGSSTGPPYGIRTVQPSYWTIAGLRLRGLTGGLVLGGPSSHWRIVSNDVSCPEGDGQVGCMATGQASYLTILGNNVHDAGKATASAHYHGVYLSTDSNHVDFGWNTVANIRGCRGIQLYSTPLGPGGAADPTGRNLYDVRIHDNLIHDTQCDGLILATIDPSRGNVEVYNNIIYNAGTGPSNPENTGGWTCINVPGSTANGDPGSGTVEVYQNTLYNCGSFRNPPYVKANAAVENGGGNPNLKINLRNNLVYQTTAAPYLVAYARADSIQGSNNLFFGNGSAPNDANVARSLNVDPQLTNASQHDFRLSSGSPARGAGIPTSAAVDKNGVRRSAQTGYDLGALQYSQPEVNALRCMPPVIRIPGSTYCRVYDRAEPSADGVRLSFTAHHTSIDAGSADLPVRFDPNWFVGDGFPAVALVVNGASMAAGSIAPGELILIFGRNFGMNPADVATLFDEVPAPVLSVKPNQISAVVPFEIAGMSFARITVAVAGVHSNPVIVKIASCSPGLFTADFSGTGQTTALNQDGLPNSAVNPAARRSTLILLATGLNASGAPPPDDRALAARLVNMAPVAVNIGGVPAEVVYAAAVPGATAGVYEVAVHVPELVSPGSAVPVSLRTGTATSQAGVTVAIE